MTTHEQRTPARIGPVRSLTSTASRESSCPSLLGNGQQRFPIKTYRQQLIEVKATMRADLKASSKSRDEVADLLSRRLKVEVPRHQIDHWVGDNPHDMRYEIGLVKATAWAGIMGHALIDDSLEELGRCSVERIDAEIARLCRLRDEAAHGLTVALRRAS